MMITPCKRRSFADHRDYYKNVRPKIKTRWEEGTPILRNGMVVKKQNNRRRSDSDLNILPFTLRSSSPVNLIHEEQEVFVPSITVNNNSVASSSYELHSNSVSLDISSHMEVVSFHFKDLFTQLEAFLNVKSSSASEKNFVEKQMKDLKEQANQIEFMITDLTQRASRLEKFLSDRIDGEENI